MGGQKIWQNFIKYLSLYIVHAILYEDHFSLINKDGKLKKTRHKFLKTYLKEMKWTLGMKNILLMKMSKSCFRFASKHLFIKKSLPQRLGY